MAKLSVFTWIGNAAARLCGKHGDVSAAAQENGCSRQTVYDHADKVQAAVQDAQLPGPSRAELLARQRHLEQQNAQLREQLASRSEFIEFGEDRRKRLCGVASATGLSLNQIEEVFHVLLKDQPAAVACKPKPSRATIGRWVLAACLLASAVLRVLDEHTRKRPRQLCLDELFFHGKPVLVAVEPLSMASLLCHKAKDRTAATWLSHLQGFSNLEHAIADAGTGLQSVLLELLQQREAPTQDGAAQPPDLTVAVDVFHTDKEAQTPMRRQWRRFEAAW